jgi:hypothetical protein
MAIAAAADNATANGTAADNRPMRRAPAGPPSRIAATEARRRQRTPPHRRTHRSPNRSRKSATAEAEQAKGLCRARCADAARGDGQAEEQQSQNRMQAP